MDKKIHARPNLVEPVSDKLREIVPHLPQYITTYNLTLISIIWSVIVLIGGYKSKTDIRFLYLVILGMLLHFITDTLDGAVGRFRNTGAVKWGYFIDHTMDIIILNAIFISLAMALPDHSASILVLYSIVMTDFVITHMSINEGGLDISHCFPHIGCVGPDDAKLVLSLFIVYIVKVKGNVHRALFPAISLVMGLITASKIISKQRDLHKEDMIAKVKEDPIADDENKNTSTPPPFPLSFVS